MINNCITIIHVDTVHIWREPFVFRLKWRLGIGKWLRAMYCVNNQAAFLVGESHA